MKKISLPALERLCSIYGLLEKLEKSGIKTVSSAQLGSNINTTNATVRKDISCLSMPNVAGRDYDVVKLKKYIGQDLKLFKPRKVCVVGLGRIGTAILAYEGFKEEGFEIAAGFDVSLNKIEMIVSRINLYLIHELGPIIESKGIELGIICTPAESAHDIANKLAAAGIKGILNCTTAMISVPESIVLRNIDYTGYLRILSAHISQNK